MTIAAIERLPVELLQPIFASSSYNLALIQASAILGARLSSEYVYHNTCDYYLRDQCDGHTVRSAAQRVIFASRWMTWSFFKSWIVKTYGSKGCLCGLTPEEGCFDAQWPPNFEDATSMFFSRSHLQRLAFVRCRLPKKLLDGPWTVDKVQFLRFLLWTTSMTVDWQDPETRQLTAGGRRRAFLENNLGAVELFNHNRRLGRPPTLETVQFAVADASCDRSIVYDTLRSAYRWSSSSEAWDYSSLHQWCDQRIWDDDIRGVWLRGILQSLRHSKLAFYDKIMDRDALFSNIVDAAAEAYSDKFCDEFIRNQLPWNKVSYRFTYIPYGLEFFAVKLPIFEKKQITFYEWARY
ncbi:uncharacterized protein M421DRAFT_172551 [Didymella exigua CBS 183.55]|uniref:Uncharacterized protein n=1 Tax=Didymella exigua CBS 183.55 TaxID=1150837 RepID=A0A6A5RMU4_9PLEO|nr:uncharacterized protein M421DRAFT_172551 [Didymella exigua CBS 183.55]KAF1927676.1 hypothetical protein M421DRAFT_172551 [Didymella exigua CBS 183.55]